MGEVDDEIKLKIHIVMRNIFHGHISKAHDVAEDFSDKELQSFIDTYYEYLNK